MKLAEMKERGAITDEELWALKKMSVDQRCCFYCGDFKNLYTISDALVCAGCYYKVFGNKTITGLNALKEWW